jgi:hypothetical protein
MGAICEQGVRYGSFRAKMTPALTPFFLAYSTTESTGLIIDGDHRQRDFTWDFENALTRTSGDQQ